MNEADLQIAAICAPALVVFAFLVFERSLARVPSVLGKLALLNLFANSLLFFFELFLVFGRLGQSGPALMISDWLNAAPFTVGYGLWVSDVWATFTAIVYVMPPLLATLTHDDTEVASKKNARSIGYITVTVMILVTLARVLFNLPSDEENSSFLVLVSVVAVVSAVGLKAASEHRLSAKRHKRAPAIAVFSFTLLTPIFAPITSGVLQAIAGYKALSRWFGRRPAVETPESTSIAAFGLLFCTVALLPYSTAFSPFFPLSIIFENETLLLTLLTVIFGLAVLNFELTTRLPIILSFAIIVGCLTGLVLRLDVFGLVREGYHLFKLLNLPDAPIDTFFSFTSMLYGTFGLAAVVTFLTFILFFAPPILIARGRPALLVSLIGATGLVGFLTFILALSVVFNLQQIPKILEMSAREWLDLNEELPGVLNLTNGMTIQFTKIVGLPAVGFLLLTAVGTFLLRPTRKNILDELDHSPNKSLTAAWHRKATSEPALRRTLWFVSGWPIMWTGWITGLALFAWLAIGPAALRDIWAVYSTAFNNTF